MSSGEEAREQATAQLARSVQEDVAKAKDSLREGQAALVSIASRTTATLIMLSDRH